MNCSEAKNIEIKKVLENFSIFPSKESPKIAFYYALNRKERTASLVLNYQKNILFDFGTGESYDAVSIVQTLKKCSVSEALKYLEEFAFEKKKEYQQLDIPPEKYKITEIKPLEHPALLEYLRSRKVADQKHLLKEIHYHIQDKNYFGIGFKNDSDGYEIRNKYSKICLGRKDVSTIKNSSNSLRIFEGFFDFLSFKNLENELEKEPSDYLILNSVSMISSVKNSLENYENIELYFDNDDAGNRAVEMIRNENQNAEDCRVLYSDFKDLNDWLVHKNPSNERQVSYRRR